MATKHTAYVVPWYSTAFRGDKMEQGLAEIAPVAMRYGAVFYAVHRSSEDRYKFEHISVFEHDNRAQWGEYWTGPEMTRWRAIHSGHYQVPILPTYYQVAAVGGDPRFLGRAVQSIGDQPAA